MSLQEVERKIRKFNEPDKPEVPEEQVQKYLQEFADAKEAGECSGASLTCVCVCAALTALHLVNRYFITPAPSDIAYWGGGGLQRLISHWVKTFSSRERTHTHCFT